MRFNSLTVLTVLTLFAATNVMAEVMVKERSSSKAKERRGRSAPAEGVVGEGRERAQGVGEAGTKVKDKAASEEAMGINRARRNSGSNEFSGGSAPKAKERNSNIGFEESTSNRSAGSGEVTPAKKHSAESVEALREENRLGKLKAVGLEEEATKRPVSDSELSQAILNKLKAEAKEGKEALAGTVDGKGDVEAKSKKARDFEGKKMFEVTETLNGKKEVKSLWESNAEIDAAIDAVLAKVKEQKGSDFELALRLIVTQAKSRGKGVSESLQAIEEFAAFFEANVKDKLPAELQKDALKHLITMFHRNPAGVKGLMSRIQQYIKDGEDVGTVLKGLVLTAESVSKPLLENLKKGMTIAEAHEKAVEQHIEYLKEVKKLTLEQIAELDKCCTEGLLSTAWQILKAQGHIR